MFRCVKKLVIVGALSLALALPTSATGAVKTVKSTRFNDWSPFKVTIAKGSKVKWSNATSDTHHEVKSYAYKGSAKVGSNWMSLKALHPGTTVKKTFRKPGKYFYRCPIHSTVVDGECAGMCGLVKVTS